MAQVYEAPALEASAVYDPAQASRLDEVIALILDKGLVIDADVRVSLVGIELLTLDARVVVASLDTYLRFAEAVNRLDLGEGENSQERGLPEIMGEREGGGQVRGRWAPSGASESGLRATHGGDAEQGGEENQHPGLLGQATQESLTNKHSDKADVEAEGTEERGRNQARPQQRAAVHAGGRAPEEQRRPPARRRGAR